MKSYEIPIARQAFGTLYEDMPPEIVGGTMFPGWYRVLIDGWYAGTFSAASREIAVKQFRAGLYKRG